MKKLLLFAAIIITVSALGQQQKLKGKPFSTLIPQKGLYQNEDNMIFLYGNVLCYAPHDADPVNDSGYVTFLYYPNGHYGYTGNHQLSLWAAKNDNKRHKFHAEFFIETTVATDTSTFFFYQSNGKTNKPIGNPFVIKGNKTTIVPIEFDSDISGGAIIGMFATKKINDVVPFILRKVYVYDISTN